METVNLNAVITPYPTREELATALAESQRLHRLSQELNQEQALKISNAEGVILDYISMNGELTDELKEIAEYLGMSVTKEITGTFSLEVSWTATVPLDFDADDMEISYSLECDSYDAEDFDYNEDNCTVSGEDV